MKIAGKWRAGKSAVRGKHDDFPENRARISRSIRSDGCLVMSSIEKTANPIKSVGFSYDSAIQTSSDSLKESTPRTRDTGFRFLFATCMRILLKTHIREITRADSRILSSSVKLDFCIPRHFRVKSGSFQRHIRFRHIRIVGDFQYCISSSIQYEFNYKIEDPRPPNDNGVNLDLRRSVFRERRVTIQ